MTETISYTEKLMKIKLGLLPKEAVAKPKKAIAKKSAKRKLEEKEQREPTNVKSIEKISLELWFKQIQNKHFKSNGGKCMECGDWIPLDYARHATAHLLPKKLFKSVATHPLNYLILGASCGCHQKTDRVDKFVTMKVWNEAAARIKEMIPILPFDELKYLSQQLTTALENV